MRKQKSELTGAERLRIGRRAGLVGILANLVLFGGKLAVGLVSSSVSVIADAFNNLSDAGSSVFVLVGYHLAGKPADKKHPYGHSRMEYLCGLFIAAIVTLLGLELLGNSVDNLRNGGTIGKVSPVSLGVMIGAILVKGAMALFYRVEGDRIDSASLRGSAADSIGDVLATSAVIAGMLLRNVTGPLTDGVIGCLIAVYIIVLGVKLVLEASDTLLGRAPDPELIKRMDARLRGYEGVLGIHDLVIHQYGADQIFASAHVEVDADVSVMESHDRMDNIEADFMNNSGIHLVIHMDPICISDERVNVLRGQMLNAVSEIGERYGTHINMHDFRVVFGVTHSNLIFDVAVPIDCPADDETLCREIAEAATALDPHLNTVITVDREYSSRRYGRELKE